ncbi:MAG: response regulator transcription factor, partial [Marinirhabdus sp.]
EDQDIALKEREIEFIKHTCTEMTYKEIADKMFLSPKTIEGYRTTIFEKLNLRNRTGLVIYAIKNKIFIP